MLRERLLGLILGGIGKKVGIGLRGDYLMIHCVEVLIILDIDVRLLDIFQVLEDLLGPWRVFGGGALLSILKIWNAAILFRVVVQPLAGYMFTHLRPPDL